MRNQGVENQITKKNTWENNLVFDRNEEQSKYPKSIFFFDFSNPLKQIKIDLLALKTLLKTRIKTLEKIEILALEILVENQLQMGYL